MTEGCNKPEVMLVTIRETTATECHDLSGYQVMMQSFNLTIDDGQSIVGSHEARALAP